MFFSRFLRLAVCGAVLTYPAPGPSRAEPGEQELTPERAKAALLEMMRSKAGKDLGWFDGNVADEMARRKIEAEEDGWYAWTAAFRFHPARGIYTFVVAPRPGVRACVFEYEGTFVRRDGAWSATPPRLVKAALPAGD
jgi:hypothetical protein